MPTRSCRARSTSWRVPRCATTTTSLAGKWIAYVASQTKRKPDDIKAAYIKWLDQQKPAFRNDPPLVAAFGGLEAFIADPHALLITLAPPQPVGLDQFDANRPQSFTSKLGLSVTAPESPAKLPTPAAH